MASSNAPLVFVQGPYLVRSAEYDEKKKTLHLTGDEEESKNITVFGPEKLCSITWNGEKVHIEAHGGGMYLASIEGPKGFKLPPLGPWKWADSLPEVKSDYEPSDKAWVGKLHGTFSSQEMVPV